MRNKLFAGVAFAALMIPASAYAQSTGTIDAEEGSEIVVTGSRLDDGVNGIVVPDTSKAKAVLTQEFIQRQAPGQSVNDLINTIPGVSYQNNDPYGSSGGSLNIRGFDSTRISQTFDGVPLNDSGSYAIYGNQQLDPELIEQVNVNLGSTDIDSPTAGATGATVNYRTRLPGQDFGVKLVGSVGQFGMMRVFGMVDTGEFTSFGTRAFFAASTARNDSPFNKASQIEKQQYNGRIYQPLGNNGDFLSLAGHYNENRNNFQGSVSLRTDTATGLLVPNRFPITKDEREYTIARCTTNVTPVAGTAQSASSCGSTFDERFNPSNTGNIRGASRFTLSDGLVLTVDPSYQYVKANGGGTIVANESRLDINPAGGAANCNTTANSASVSCQSFYGGQAAATGSTTAYFGRDLNGDGDTLDQVRVLAPSQTQTHRIGVISSLRYDLAEGQNLRLSYTYDRARHRQTGETRYLRSNGTPVDVFPVNNGLADVNGTILQKRDRLSFAILHQVSAEYRGSFFDNTFNVTAGVRAPFFKRNLTNYCATTQANGNVQCGSPSTIAAYLAANPLNTVSVGAAAASGATCVGTVCTFPIQGPQQRILNYKKVLPSIGYTADVTQQISLFGNYSMGLQVPGTDNLYNSFYYPAGTANASPKPETSDNFETGVRYRSSTLQAQVTAWYTDYKNRLAASYDPELDKSVYRNLGRVKKYGFDGSITYQPIRELNVYAFGSYLHSEIEDDVVIGRTTAAGPLGPIGSPIYAPTAGKREANAPVYTFGGGAQVDLDIVSVGVNVKRTGPRYLYDTNQAVYALVGGVTTQVYGSKAPAYTLVDLNARVDLTWAGLNKSTYFQVNVLNVFDTLWVGSVNSGNGALNQGPGFNSTGTAVTSYGFPLNSQIGYPRTVMGSLVVGF